MPVVVTGAVYQLTKSDTLMADPNNALNQVPAGEIRSRGVELEAKAALNANINMTASYTYTDAIYTKDTNLKGNTVVQVPKHMASLWGLHLLRWALVWLNPWYWWSFYRLQLWRSSKYL